MNNKFMRFILESKKELTLFFCALFFVFSVMKISTLVFIDLNEKSTAEVDTNQLTAYRLFIEEQDMGLVGSLAEGEAIISQAIGEATDELGYEAELDPKVRIFEEEIDKDMVFTSTEDLLANSKQVILDTMDSVKVKAFVMKIGEDFVVALNSKEEVTQVLKNAQSLYVSGDTDFEIELFSDPHNSFVETPKVLLKEPDDADRVFTANPLTEDVVEENEEEEDNGATTIDMEFSEEVIIVEAYIDEDKIYTVDQATELITKENEEPKIYVVKSGDCLSTIAEDNDMTLAALFSLNQNIDEDDFLQIGDELTVMVPEPELSVSTREEIQYKTDIARKTVYVENPDKYAGSETVIDNGSSGEMLVTAVLTKVNGQEVERTVTDQEIVLEPTNRIIEKGSKALPPKGATGNYIPPLTDYIVTSGFGYRWGGFHYGVDMAASTGTIIRATDGGVVTHSGWMGTYGYLVIIDHGNGVESRYAHCSSLSVSVGQQVSQYQEIARVGSTGRSTGPHLHFEIRFDDVAANPMNYLDY